MGAVPRLPSRYVPLGLLGEGGSGRVWLVEDRHRPGKRLALKELADAEPRRARELALEFATLTQFRHPALVEVAEFRATTESGRPFFTLEHIDGEEIVAAVQREGPELFGALVAEALRALSFLHDFGLVHRDLKPGNLLVRRRPRLGYRLVVLDFGLAMRGEGDETGLRTTAGTLPYIAPELFDGVPAGPRSDLYALGAVLFEAIHGRPLFRMKGDDVAAFIEAVRSGRRARPSVPEGYPDGLGDWLNELLASDPAARPAGAGEALARFNEACGTDFPGETAAGRAARLASGSPPGREAEIESVWNAIENIRHPRVVWLSGGPGSGKKRMLRWLGGEAVARGWDVAWLSAPATGPDGDAHVEALLEDLRARAVERPTLALLGETERAGSRIVELLERVAREGKAPPLRVVASLRPAEVRVPGLRRMLDQSGRVPTLRRVDLPPLDGDALRELAARTGESRTVSRAKLRWLSETSDGNPMLAEALLVEGVWESGGRKRHSVRAERSLQTRIDRLPASGAAFLEALAVLGGESDESVVADVAALTENDAGEAAADLASIGLARGGNGRWSIDSRALAAQVLGRLDEKRCATLYGRAASRLERQEGADRFLLARLWHGSGEAERSVRAAIAAADHATDPILAARCLAFAVARLARRDPRRSSLRLRQAEALRAANLPADASRAYAGALRGEKDEATRADLTARRAMMLIQAGRFDLGRREAESVLPLAGDDPATVARAREAIGSALARSGKGEQALPELRAAVEAFARVGNRHAEAHALQALALCETNEGLPEAEGHFRRAIEMFRALNLPGAGLINHVGLAMVEQRAARYEKARAILEETRSVAVENRNWLIEGLATCTLAQNALLEGRYAEALSLARESESQAGFLDDERLLFISRGAAAVALVRCGRTAEATAILEDTLARSADRVDPVMLEFVHLARAEAVLARQGDGPDLAGALADSLRRARRLNDPETLLWAVTLEMERRARGGATEPLAPLREELDELVARGGPWDQPYYRAQGDLATAAWELERGESGPAEKAAQRAAEVARATDVTAVEAKAMGLLADALATGGNTQSAARAQERGRLLLERAARRIEDEELRRGLLERRSFANLKHPVGFVPSSINRRLLALYDMIGALNSETDPDALLESILDMALEVVGAERGMILLRDAPNSEFTVRVARNLEQETVLDAEEFSRHIVAQAGAGRAVLAHDAQQDERFSELKSVSLYGIHSLMCVPLRSRGRIIGTVYLDNRRVGRLFAEEDLRFLEAFSDHAALALENTRARASLIRENVRLREVAAERVQFGNIVGSSESMLHVFDVIGKVAPNDAPVLICGESGTGKELVARAIHIHGPRRDQAFIAENCAAIPESLLQSELFGHVRGAFTGADRERPGLFEQAHGGTLFLDEIGDMSPGMQAQLLRVIQEGEVRRVGGERSISVDVRLLAATHRDLQAEASAGRFREDLMYRLQVLVIQLPPLRERVEDIPLLVDHFMERIAAERGRAKPDVMPEVLDLLARYTWPGNVRQLESTLQRMSLLVGGGPLTRSVVEQDPGLSRTLAPREQPAATYSLQHSEKDKISQALGASAGNRARAARMLGISRATIYRKIKDYGL